MKNLHFLVIIGLASIIFGCKNSENDKVINAGDLKTGEKLGDLTLSGVNKESDVLTLEFSDEIEVEGLMIFDQSPTMISIDKSVLKGKVDFNGKTIDLSGYETVSFTNYEELAKYIPLEWREESMTDDWQLKAEKNKKVKVKLKINNIIFNSECPFPVSANITEVLAFDGETSPKAVSATESKKIKAKLDMIVLASDGGWSQFTDEYGQTYMFFDDGNEQLHENIKDINPNSTDHKYKNIWFDIEYKTISHPFYDGGTGNTENRDVEVITFISVSGKSDKSQSAIIADLTKMEFGAPEDPEWSLKFFDNYMLFSRDYEATVVKLSYKSIEEGETETRITGGNLSDPNKGSDFLIIMKKEHCELSMGYENFPYSMSIKSEGKTICTGCGKYVK